MNVTDFKNTLPEGKDLLTLIFERQLDKMLKYHVIEEKNLGRTLPHAPFDLDDAACQERIKDFMWRITEELGEAANCLKNKPWKNTHMTTDKIHFLEEIVDSVHFMVELLIMIGFTPETITMMYLDKNDVNGFRIDSNY